LKQISNMAAPGSRICFDALHRDHMDGRVHNRGFSCGVEVILEPSQYHLEVLWRSGHGSASPADSSALCLFTLVCWQFGNRDWSWREEFLLDWQLADNQGSRAQDLDITRVLSSASLSCVFSLLDRRMAWQCLERAHHAGHLVLEHWGSG